MKKVGDIIAEFFKERFGNEFFQTAQSTAALFSSWGDLLTEAWHSPENDAASLSQNMHAAAHSRVKDLARGVLIVEADHPGWIQILQTKQADILSAVQQRHPQLDIRSITFRLSREKLGGA